MSLTDEEWIMVDANFGPSIIWRYSLGKRIELELEEVKCRLIKNKTSRGDVTNENHIMVINCYQIYALYYGGKS